MQGQVGEILFYNDMGFKLINQEIGEQAFYFEMCAYHPAEKLKTEVVVPALQYWWWLELRTELSLVLLGPSIVLDF